jgi:hypothetical protein
MEVKLYFALLQAVRQVKLYFALLQRKSTGCSQSKSLTYVGA